VDRVPKQDFTSGLKKQRISLLSLGFPIISNPPACQIAGAIPPLRSGPLGDKPFRGFDALGTSSREARTKQKQRRKENAKANETV